ncbi:hypothetical protein QAD02_005369 [Eretmocerus hayati]|uniref:Uncharacterized protein n=1 Tax=Eretmocerus hayati TaxID=131215 RepID=A0ACC2NSK6_9HYME|nr:hypothetical protein QAD02_005369 [Eretmocerus hayati]
MTLIEGVGDEVLNFFTIVGVLLVGWIAWCSTNIADQPLIRTVLILQHRTRTRIAALRASQAITPTQPSITNLDSSNNETQQTDDHAGAGTDHSCPESSLSATSQVPPDASGDATATNEEVLIRAMDTFNEEGSTMINEDSKVNEVKKPSDGATDKESVVGTESIETTEPEQIEETETSSNNEPEICIKLKFINDDQKLVTGSLGEMLGDFKRRHFQMELESRKLVRLVFNGHVLQPDNITLEQCGFFNNCVVHCLIHQPRPAPVVSNTLDNSSRLYFNPPPFQNVPAGAGFTSVQTEWDLSRLLALILGLILGSAWYFRYHYAQLFTVTTTVGLFGLTAIFTVSLFGHLFPDPDSIRNIE